MNGPMPKAGGVQWIANGQIKAAVRSGISRTYDTFSCLLQGLNFPPQLHKLVVRLSEEVWQKPAGEMGFLFDEDRPG